MEIVVYDFTSRTNISIAPDGNALHRVDGTPTHPNPFVDDYLSTVFCHNNASLRQSKHIAEWMGENVDFTPPSVVKKDIRPFHSTHHAEAPKIYLLAIYHAAFQIQQKIITVRIIISIVIFKRSQRSIITFRSKRLHYNSIT